MQHSAPTNVEPALITAVASTPLVAAAVHAGHQVRDDLLPCMKLDAAGRLREEDPFTDEWTHVAETRIVGLRSRFEVDLNRPRDLAIYKTPEQSWGLEVWTGTCTEAEWNRSLTTYDRFYEQVHALLEQMERRFGRFVVLDIHSYNHRRGGSDAEAADPLENPDINIGTGTMQRERWARVVDRTIRELRGHDLPQGPLDVRENVRFFGGHFPRWIHEHFPRTGCAIAIEVKKFFMDEWTGEPFPAMMAAVHDTLGSAARGILDELRNW